MTKQTDAAADVDTGDKVTIKFIGGHPRAEQSITGEVVEATADRVVVSTDLGRVFHQIDDGMVQSAKTRGNLGGRHGRTRGEFTGLEVTA